MSIDQHISVTAIVNNAGIATIGFGTIGILSYTTLFTGRSRTYRRVADMITDGFAADGPEVAAASRIFGQSPRPDQLKILRGDLPPTQRYELLVTDAIEGHVHTIKVKGEGVVSTTVEYEVEGGDDEGDIAGELVTVLNAVEDKNYTAAIDGSDPNLIIVTGDDPGNWFSLEVASSTVLLSIAQTHADPGIATDLANILIEDSDWYYLDTNFNSEAMVLEAAELIEATAFKAYIVDLVDSDIENTSAPGSDIAAQLNALGYKRTLYSYHRKPSEDMAAAWEGRLAPLNVGSWTAAYKSLTGVTADSFTATQMTNLDAKKCSYYKAEAGRSITWKGWVANTDYGYFSTTVEIDFVVDLIQKRLFGVFVAMLKVAITDEDIQGKLKPAGQGALNIAKSDKHKIVAPGTPGEPNDPEPLFTFPRVKDIPAEDRAAGHIPDGTASFRLQGAALTAHVDLTAVF
jgi:hypothetical protein